MIRQMRPGDETRLEAFLSQLPDTSMFLRANLAAHGLGPSEHPHATTYVAVLHEETITGVIARTRSGLLMVQAPRGPEVLASAFRGEQVVGMTGEAGQVRVALAAMGLEGARYKLLHDEPLCALDLATAKASDVTLRPANDADAAILVPLFAQHLLETGLEPDEVRAAQAAEARAALAAGRRNLRLVLSDGEVLGMTDFNARTHDMVQIGGVHVIPRARGRGLAGQMVLAHLAEARAGGVRRAVLFANNPAAFRAYRRVGFQRIGSYRVALLDTPQEIPA